MPGVTVKTEGGRPRARQDLAGTVLVGIGGV